MILNTLKQLLNFCSIFLLKIYIFTGRDTNNKKVMLCERKSVNSYIIILKEVIYLRG